MKNRFIQTPSMIAGSIMVTIIAVFCFIPAYILISFDVILLIFSIIFGVAIIVLFVLGLGRRLEFSSNEITTDFFKLGKKTLISYADIKKVELINDRGLRLVITDNNEKKITLEYQKKFNQYFIDYCNEDIKEYLSNLNQVV